MIPNSRAWAGYRAWNHALRLEIFTTENDGRPVYLDPEEAVLAGAAKRIGALPDLEPEQALAMAIRQTISLEDTDPLAQHRNLAEKWRRQARSRLSEVDEPPFIALLMVFTLAAERMGSKKDLSPNAYYPLLTDLLGAHGKTQENRVRNSFVENSEAIWRALNFWLDSYDGRYGLPTAYALGHRYVGLPASQALIRDSDRVALQNFFGDFGLPPGSDLPAGDLEPLLGEWIGSGSPHVTKRLRDLWSRKGARPRLADSAATELAQWDGSGIGHSTSAGVGFNRTLLCVNVNRVPVDRLEVTVVSAFNSPMAPSVVTIEANGSSAEIETITVSGRRVRPRDAIPFDLGSILVGVLTVRAAVSDSPSIRMPRRVVPLRYDPLLGAYVECDQISLGEDYYLLVKRDEKLIAGVQSALAQHCRPGYKPTRGISGLPEGWVLVRNVQFMTAMSSPAHSDLAPLVPLIRTKLTVDSGFRFPGRVPRWSVKVPPEIRVASEAHPVRVVLESYETPGAEDPHEWLFDDGVGIVQTAGLDLEDGDYTITLLSGEKELQRTEMRLRSGDMYDAEAWARSPRLLHDCRQPLDALRAREAGEDVTLVVDGAWTSGSDGGAPEVIGLLGEPWWDRQESEQFVEKRIEAMPLSDGSCIYTGAHRFDLPATPARQQNRRELRGQYHIGRCTGCGIVKRFPMVAPSVGMPALKRMQSAVKTAALTEISAAEESATTWDVAVDGLVHAGGGSASALRAMASQVQGTAMFIDGFTRALESLAHIEVERDDRFDVTRWEIAFPSIAELPSGELFLCGSWTEKTRHSLGKAVTASGGSFSQTTNRHGLSRWIVQDLSLEQVEGLSYNGSGDANHVPNAAESIACLLPSMSAIAAGLPRIPLPGSRQIRRFKVSEARWVNVSDVDRPGSYRLSHGFSTVDVFVTERDIAARTAGRCSVYAGKHLAAWLEARPLLAYDQPSGDLTLPLGCDLPGLFGRAAVLCSGTLPEYSRTSGTLRYRDVSPAVARILQHRLSS